LAPGLRDSRGGWALYAPRCLSIRNHKVMERIPGQDDELSIDEEDGTVVLLEAGRPLRGRVKAGLVTAVAALGLASLSLAMAPWHRGAAIVGDNPQRQGQRGTKLLHSLNSHPVDRGTLLTQAAAPGDYQINVRNTTIFMVGDDFVLANTNETGSVNEEMVVKSIEDGKVTLVDAMTKNFPAGSYTIVPADPISESGSHYHEKAIEAPEDEPSTNVDVASADVASADVASADVASAHVASAHRPHPQDDGGHSAAKVWLGLFLFLLFAACFLSAAFVAYKNHLSKTTAGASKKEGHWMFKPTDGRAVIALASPNFDAPETGEVVYPGDRLKVLDTQPPMTAERFSNTAGGVEMQEEDLGEGDVLFLKLADGRGWVLDREPGNVMCYELFAEVNQRWTYMPEKSGGHMPILEVPDITGRRTGVRLHPRDKFNVSEIQAFSDNGILFLKLADGRGWVYDQHVDDGEQLCRRIVQEMWKYQPANGAPMAIRKYPNIDGERTAHKMQPEETFEVDEVVIGDRDNNLLLLKLTDGRGWVFNKHPDIGPLCDRIY